MAGRSIRTIVAALGAAILLMPVAAPAYPGGYGNDPRGYEAGRDYDRGGGYDREYRYARGYDAPPPPPVRYRNRGYRDADYGPPGYARRARGYRCDNGTSGTILGAIAGGLLGNGVAGRGDRGAGTIIGAGVGALAGRAIDRNC